MLNSLLLAAGLCLTALPAAASDWVLDRDNTRIQVDVGYLGRTVKVFFNDVSGDIDFDPRRPQSTQADIRVRTSAAETGLGIVNGLVRGQGYLNARQHPEIGFALDKLTVTGPSTARVTGRITLLGVTRPAAFDAKLTKLGPDRADPSEAAFFLSGQIDRAAHGNTTGIPQVSQYLPVKIELTMRAR